MYILEIFPLLLLLIKKEVRTIGFVFCGARPDRLCLNSTATPAPNTFLAEILFKNVKYSQNVKTFRVQEIRPGPVKRNFVGKEKAASRKLLQKWSFRKFAQMDRDGVVVVIL